MTLRAYALLLSASLGLFAASSDAAISYRLEVNFDGTRTTAYPNGDKPQGGTCPPSGWTQASVGDGGGQICELSATNFTFNVFGSTQAQNNTFVYQDGGGADVQIQARILNTYAGSAEANASTGVGIRESTSQSAWFMQCHSLQSGSTAVQCSYGSAGTYTNSNCASGQSRPIYVGVSYDDSESDVRGFWSLDGSTWNECVQVARNLSDDLAYIFGASKSAVTTLQAEHDGIELDNAIDFYTPAGGGGGPLLVTPIEDQTGSQGGAFSLSCAANFTGATSYSVSGLAGSTGITFNTSNCSFSGNFNANDVGTRTVTVTASNASGDTPDSFELAVSASSGDVFLIATSSSNRTYNCNNANGANGASWTSIRTSGTGTQPLAGDTIVLAGGTHAHLTFQFCSGTPSSYLTIRNDTSDNEPAVIRKTSATQSGSVLTFNNSDNFHVDGSGKYVGAPAGVLGVNPSTFADGRTQAGIIVTRSATSGRPNRFVRAEGTSCTPGCIFEGIEVDGIDHADTATEGNSGICFSLNDHTVKAVDFPGVWREDIIFRGNYPHNCGGINGEGFYIGPNADELDLPLRDVTFEYNLVEHPAGSCMQVKNVRDGTNGMYYNHLYDCGEDDDQGHNYFMHCQCTADFDFIGNVGTRTTGFGIQFSFQDATPGEAGTLTIENNILGDVGNGATPANDVIKITKASSAPALAIVVRGNTLAEAPAAAIDCASSVTGRVINNIFAATNTQAPGCPSASNNRTGTLASQNFTNAAFNDYTLTATSPACNSATADMPDDDFEGDARPQGSADDQGADESSACP